MKRNETKKMVLSILGDLGPAQAWQIRSWINYENNLDLSRGAIAMALSRLRKWKLVKNRSGLWEITNKGRERLEFYQRMVWAAHP